MAKYGKSAQRSVKRAIHNLEKGARKGGKSGSRVKNREQAIAIGLWEAIAIGLAEVRRKRAKVPGE